MLISLFLFLDFGTQGIPWWSSGQESGLPLWEAWLLSHVIKLRSYHPLDATKENKKQGGNRLSLKKKKALHYNFIPENTPASRLLVSQHPCQLVWFCTKRNNLLCMKREKTKAHYNKNFVADWNCSETVKKSAGTISWEIGHGELALSSYIFYSTILLKSLISSCQYFVDSIWFSE